METLRPKTQASIAALEQIYSAIAQFLIELKGHPQSVDCLVVAWSGGLDSSVLLHALNQASCPFKLSSIYVNHGLSKQATDWQVHCEQLAQEWQIPHQSISIDLHSGSNLEARARELRYACLQEHLPQQACLVTAHHQQDQAETVLARLFQGAGIQGLTGISQLRPLTNHASASGLLGRPLLDVSQQAILDYALHFDLIWVDDPMNQESSYERAFMRRTLWPVLSMRYSDPAAKIAYSANLLQQTQSLLADYLQTDWQAWSHSAYWFDWAFLQEFSWPRQQALVARWFDYYHGLVLRATHWQWLKKQVFTADSQRHPKIMIARQAAQRYRTRVYYPAQPHFFSESFRHLEDLQAWLEQHWPLPVNLEGMVIEGPITIRNRHASDGFGGEGLKKWFQQQGVPPWLRASWPVLETKQGQVLLGFKKS